MKPCQSDFAGECVDGGQAGRSARGQQNFLLGGRIERQGVENAVVPDVAGQVPAHIAGVAVEGGDGAFGAR